MNWEGKEKRKKQRIYSRPIFEPSYLIPKKLHDFRICSLKSCTKSSHGIIRYHPIGKGQWSSLLAADKLHHTYTFFPTHRRAMNNHPSSQKYLKTSSWACLQAAIAKQLLYLCGWWQLQGGERPLQHQPAPHSHLTSGSCNNHSSAMGVRKRHPSGAETKWCPFHWCPGKRWV